MDSWSRISPRTLFERVVCNYWSAIVAIRLEISFVPLLLAALIGNASPGILPRPPRSFLKASNAFSGVIV